MAQVYNIFLSGSKNPVWTYKTWRGLRKRLLTLAADTHLRKVEVAFGEERVVVGLHRGPNGYGWQTAVGVGIEHDNGLRCSAFERSW